MASNTHSRKRSNATQVYLDTSSFDQSTPERRTRSTRKIMSEGSPAVSKRFRRSTTVSSNSSEDGDVVRLTKTGRISKALKGQPVHTCGVCSKCYTRAEHLRRHLLSHQNQSPTTTQWERSQNPDWKSKKDKDCTPSVDKSSTRAPSALPDIRVDQSSWSYSDYPEHSGLGAQYASSYEYPQGSFEPTRSITATEHVSRNDASTGPPFSTVSYGYAPVTEGGSWWQPDVPDLYAGRSISPASLSSLTLPMWTGTPEDYSSILGVASPSISAYSSPSMQSLCHFDQANLQTMSLLDTDEQDNARICDDIQKMSGITNDPLGHSSLVWLEERYADLYFQHFHPCFPILNRPTYSIIDHPNLLKILVIAIGASFRHTTDAGFVAEALATSADDILKHHPLPVTGSRVVDLQIAFLMEIYMLFRSRRPVQKLPQPFKALSSVLQHDLSMNSLNIDDSVASLDPTREVAQAQARWVNGETRQRLLLACYTLEIQQATLFGRDRELTWTDMLMPCSVQSWEERDTLRWLSLLQESLYHSTHLHETLNNPRPTSDPFTTAILSALYSTTGISPTSALITSLANHPQGSFTHHALLLAAHAPVRHLLAVAGESFVLGHKLSSSLHYDTACHAVQTWVATPTASTATNHAAQTLRCSFHANEPLGLLLEEWTLYLAALVCWAVGRWGQQHLYLIDELHYDGVETERNMRAFLARFDEEEMVTPTEAEPGVSDYVGTRACLAWTLETLQGRSAGGLVSDAVFVLGKLCKISV